MADWQNLIVRIGADASGLDKALGKIENKMNRFANRLNAVGRTMTTSLTLPLAAAGGAALKMATDWESAFAGVRKTVDATEAEFSELAAGIRQMAQETPHSAVALAGIAEAAGQLGIQTDAILDFTRVMADMGVATNMTAEEAATSMARFANIMQMPQDQFDRLGSVIVDLGNNLATTESEILEFGLRIAGAGKLAGLTEAQVMAIGGAMSSVGVQAEAGGTAVQKVLMGITQSVAQGNDKLQTFAATAGLSAEEFARLWRDDAAEAFTLFVEGLGAAGEDAFVILEELGLQDQRLMRAFLSLAGAGDVLRDSIERSTEAWKDNTALSNEAEERYKTFEQQLKNLWNQLVEVGIVLGEALMPLAREAIEMMKPWVDRLKSLAEWFANLSEEQRKTWATLALIVAAIGPLLLGLGGVIRMVTGVIGTLRTLGVVLQFLALNPVGMIITAIGLLIAAGVAIYKNWDEIRRRAVIIWGGIVDTVGGYVTGLKNSFLIGIENIKRIWYEGIQKILEFVEPIITVLPQSWQQAFQGMKASVERSALESRARMRELSDEVMAGAERMVSGLQQIGEGFSRTRKVVQREAGYFDDSAWTLGEGFERVGEAADSAIVPVHDFGSVVGGAGGVADAVDLLALRLERLQSKWRAYAAVNADAAGSATYLDAQLENLNEQLSIVTHQVDEMSRRYREVAAATGEYSAESLRLGTELDGLIEKQAQLTAEIKRTEEEKRKAAGGAINRDEWINALQILHAEGNMTLGFELAEWGINAMRGIPGLWQGGTVRSPGTVLVGERGPELLHLPRGATVEPLNNRGGDTINVTVNVHGVDDPERLTRIVAENIRRGKLAM